MTEYLERQLGNSQDIKDIIKQLDLEINHDDGRIFTTLLVYLPTRDDANKHDHFFELVKQGILANFVFSCTEVESKLGVGSREGHQEIFEKSVRKLSRHTAKGELGELILFTLLDVYFEAPKILSKVSMKTAPGIPVFGADAVHGQFVDDRFRLYLGEAKLHKIFNSASTSAAKSIKNAMAKYVNEFDLLDSHMDFPNLDANLEEKLLNLLNPFVNEDLGDIVRSPCFIGFSQPKLFLDNLSSDDFLEKYGELAKKYVKHFFSKIEKNEISIDKTSLIILPFSCIDELVEGFVTYMGITN